MRRKIDSNRIAGLKTGDQLIEEKYGKPGSASRDEFDAKAKAWYYAEVLRDARKTAGLTQQEVADKIGKKRAYVALIEKGETDMQLSTFILMSEAVGLQMCLITTV